MKEVKMEIKDICAHVNALRERYGNSELIQEDLRKALPQDLKNRIYNLELNGIVIVRKEGTRKMYSFPSEPIHISKIEAALRNNSKKLHKLNEQQCINYLKSLGYKILKQKFVEV